MGGFGGMIEERKLLRVMITLSLQTSPQTGVAIRLLLPHFRIEECNKEMQYYVYILTNNTGTTMYIGVTKDLVRRMYEHKHKLDSGSFTAKYDVHKLVYYEYTTDVRAAIEREKQLKGWNRARKNKLVETRNPSWQDLYESILP